MKFQSNAIFNGTITANSVANAGTNTNKFLVLDSSGNVDFRTAAELYSDLGIGSLPAGFTSTVKHAVKAGVALTKGQAVYVTSADGTNMIVGKASNASEATSSKTMGLIESTLSLNGIGNVITEGLLAGLDTTAATNPGDPVWLGVDGNLIYGLNNKPSAPNHLVFIGIVTRINANNGEIFVKVQNGFEMGELHNYAEGSVQNNQVIVYESATSLYKPKSISTILGYTPANDSDVVKLSGNQTINGFKTFTAGAYANGGILINNASTAWDTGYIGIGATTTGLKIGVASGVNQTLTFPTGTSYTYTFPSGTGTLALTSDLGSYVTLSTSQTISGAKTFSNNVRIDNGSASAFLGFKQYSSGSTGIAGFTSIYAISTDTFGISFGAANDILFKTASPTFPRTYTFPDATGTVALTSDITAAIPTRVETVFTATANQSVFTVNYTVGAVEVFYNGSKMTPDEFTATNGTSITLASGIPAGTILTVVANGIGGGITRAALSATAPLVYNSNTGAFSIQAASGSQNGYLSSGDWTSFNNKVSSQWVTSGSDIYYSTGKVSIGTSTIGRKLSIYSTTGDDHLLIAGTAPSVSMTDTMSGATYQAKWGLATSNGDFATGAVAGDFVISCQTGSTIWAANSVEKMRLNASGKLLIGTTSTASSSLLVVNGGFTATTIIKSGGTSSQFLKADGSVDSSTYLTGITSGQVTGALGYTPYNSSNPSGYITGTTSGNFYINNTSPTIYLQDTDHRSSMIHCNSNTFYILRGNGNNSTTWATSNGYWPLTINLENNDATFGGNLTAVYDVTAYSDARVKENVTTIEGALDKVLALRGVRYQRTDMEDRKFHIGVIAQETQPIVPEIVNENEKGHLNVAYGNMGGLFIEAIKELKKENNELRDILKRNNLI